ncbi:TIGR04086 family membrane protein [Arthrobacter sp. ISL-69]|uniref:TIGR04086 family membrane protein n=1 Tax=Arthrobacter sp. ISL-69 TaxID=2819113 RepID=UPI001BE57010|nr:TIGR04086 family membrane protein [Arthrobacter sp. ISL-69]MBT2537770.1 TIGR04086 family membrane protein [Arthrobacter sp. ISL-69]
MSSTVGPEDRQSRRAARGADANRVDGAGREVGTGNVENRNVEDRLEGRRSPADAPRASRNYVPATEPDDDTRAYAVTPTAEAAALADPNAATRETVVAREKEQFGGIKIGSAFFGWLAATGTAVLLTALVAAAGTAVGLATNTDVNEAVNQASSDQTVGLTGVIVLLVILFVSYYCGGYVAGRMARFGGAKQGFMVWVWAAIFAVIIALLAMIAGERFNILANLNSFPRIPVNEGQLTTTGIIAAVVVAAVALVGAVVGGMAGMRFHRKVDRAGFTPVEADSER